MEMLGICAFLYLVVINVLTIHLVYVYVKNWQFFHIQVQRIVDILPKIQFTDIIHINVFSWKTSSSAVHHGVQLC